MGGESVGIMANILNGAFWPCVPAHGLPVVDVEDVVAAHSLAAVSPKAKGRRVWSCSDPTPACCKTEIMNLTSSTVFYPDADPDPNVPRDPSLYSVAYLLPTSSLMPNLSECRN
jgi:hypothetical protein